MDIQIQPGTYVVAVSGGVDSMALLHMLSRLQNPDLKLIVAHFDHGIRQDSKLDRQHVQATARSLSLPFVYNEGNLGAGTSEDEARIARYKFLHTVRTSANATAIITAHHQDDVLETAIMNLLRGTHRRGLSSLQNTDVILRPLLRISKQNIAEYANTYGIAWREDSTNHDLAYKRNYVRHTIVRSMPPDTRAYMVQLLDTVAGTNKELDAEIQAYLAEFHQPAQLHKEQFLALPMEVAKEVLASWLRQNGICGYDRKTLARIVEAAHRLEPGKLVNIVADYFLKIERDWLTLEQRVR